MKPFPGPRYHLPPTARRNTFSGSLTIVSGSSSGPQEKRPAILLLEVNNETPLVVVLRQGSNGILCWDESSDEAFSSTCTSEENRARVEQNYAFNNSGGTSDEIRAMFDAAEQNGTREVSGFGTIYEHLNGPDQASARSHMNIVVPFATSESHGLPDSGRRHGVWIMDAGTSTAHLQGAGSLTPWACEVEWPCW